MATESRRIVAGDGAGVVITDIKRAPQTIRDAQKRVAEISAASREPASQRLRERHQQLQQAEEQYS
jgi:hypothetical protein